MRHVRRRKAHPRSAVSSVVGGVGELLITAGAVLGLFVVWQLWWTSVVALGQAQVLMDDFNETVVEAPRQKAELRTDAPPVPAPAAHGATIGVLIVPEWYGRTDNAMPIVEGTTPELLKNATAGHYEQTQQVGEVGNFALAGHRRTHGDSFFYVDALVAGDQVIVRTPDTWYVYEVTSHTIVLPDKTHVIAPVPEQEGVVATDRVLTLTTCHSLQLGAYGNDHRWITYATFVGWMPAADGMPEQVVDLEGVR